MPENALRDLHEKACARGAPSYRDPDSGLHVFTRTGLLERGKCCGSGCRHCPFAHDGIDIADRPRRIQQAAWLTGARPHQDKAVTLLFWSGGKDSYLALRAFRRMGRQALVLVTTFDAASRIVAHQELPIDAIVDQALRLCLPLIGVPLHPGGDYLDSLLPALDAVPNCIECGFGDLHLEQIRAWREETFAAHPRTAGLQLTFPIWQVDYQALLKDLQQSGAGCRISAVAEGVTGVSVGETFDAAFIMRLPEGIDAFGENGEFHTRILPAGSEMQIERTDERPS